VLRAGFFAVSHSLKALASGRQTATDASLRFRQPNAELSSDDVDEGLIRGWLGLEKKISD
jgi:hypothetical protein